MPSYSGLPKEILAVNYGQAAQVYLRNLPPEHFMEALGQSTQREITLSSLALVKARRKDFQVFNELLVQYPLRDRHRLGQVVPDNMVVLCEQRIKATSSFNLPLEPAGPFWVLEYVSNSNKRKDYEESFEKYERHLKVPYYLIYYPDDQELSLYRHNGRKYISVKPGENGRYSIPEVDMEIGLLDGWVRYWYQGELLPLPADLQRELDETRRRADEEKRRADEEKRRADELQERLRVAEQELAQLKRRRNGPSAGQ
jgi:Uma2 family endonuclease